MTDYQREVRRHLSFSKCMEMNEHISDDVGVVLVFCIFIFKYFLSIEHEGCYSGCGLCVSVCFCFGIGFCHMIYPKHKLPFLLPQPPSCYQHTCQHHFWDVYKQVLKEKCKAINAYNSKKEINTKF
jgi:hypothetical protein